MITLFILFLIVYAIGYMAGYLVNREYIEEGKQYISQRVKEITEKQTPTGQIKPKTPDYYKKKSMDANKREGLDAMKETLDRNPELSELKRRMQHHERTL